MNRFIFSAMIAPLILFAAISGGTTQEEKKSNAKPASIPKDQIYATSSEGGFKERLAALFLLDEKGEPRKPRHSYSVDLEDIRRHRGASNLFLVRGDDLATAIKSTKMLFVNGFPADSLPDADFAGNAINSEKYWLVAYLGSGHSEPSKWTFKSCVVTGNTIEFIYEGLRPLKEGESRGHSDDSIQYFYWVPLPVLKEGPVELKLIDARKGRPMLTRSVDNP